MKYLLLLLIAALVVVFYYSRRHRMEAFGMSPGTLVQLQSSHVPTGEDDDEMKEYVKQVRHDLVDMTGSA
jgi:hypothetical protein